MPSSRGPEPSMLLMTTHWEHMMSISEFFAYLLADERSRDLAVELVDAYCAHAELQPVAHAS